MNRTRSLGVFAVMIVATNAANLSAMPFNDVLIFGDSFSDTGNVFEATGGLIPQTPYFMGRFSDGPVWVEYLAADLGLTVTANGGNPTVIIGNNFAAGGAMAAVPIPTPLGTIPSLIDQVDYYLAASPVPLDAAGLYVIFAGNNDLRNAVDPSQNHNAAAQQQIIQAAADAVVDSVQGLADAGARNVLVLHIGDLGLAPETGPTERNNSAASTIISMDFNTQLTTSLANLTLPTNTNVIEFDTFSFGRQLYDDAVHHGGAVYGITNFAIPIFPGYAGSPGADPAVSAFADDLHLSTVAHSILANEVYRTLVPEPSVLVLLITAAPLVAMRRLSRDQARFRR